jgi:hypothetical protein
MDHRLSEILGRRFAGGVAQCLLMGHAIVLNEVRVIDGNVRSPLFKIGDWVAASPHGLAQERVGVSDGATRVVDESRLGRGPTLVESLRFVRSKRAQVESFDTLFALLELGFTLLATGAVHRSAIFTAELLLKSFGGVCLPLLFHAEPDGEGYHYPNQHDPGRYNHPDSHDECSLLEF